MTILQKHMHAQVDVLLETQEWKRPISTRPNLAGLETSILFDRFRKAGLRL